MHVTRDTNQPVLQMHERLYREGGFYPSHRGVITDILARVTTYIGTLSTKLVEGTIVRHDPPCTVRLF